MHRRSLAWGHGGDESDTGRDAEKLAGDILRAARSRRGWTQRKLAEAAGVPRSRVARIEQGLTQPTLPTLAQLLAAADLELRTPMAPYDENSALLDTSPAWEPPPHGEAIAALIAEYRATAAS